MTVVEIKPSRLLVILVMALHVAAAFAFAMWISSPWVSDAGLFCIAASWLYFVSVWPRRNPARLGLMDDGTLLFDPDGRCAKEAVLMPATVVSDAAVWLVWRVSEEREGGVVLILRDQLAPMNWRILQIWARLRVKPAGASPRA